MTIREINEQELQERLKRGEGAEAVFFYTVMCGTCKLAERMLDIAQTAIGQKADGAAAAGVSVSKISVNYAPVMREAWQIASVPCLALVSGGRLLRKEYALQSVDYIYRLLQAAAAAEQAPKGTPEEDREGGGNEL